MQVRITGIPMATLTITRTGIRRITRTAMPRIMKTPTRRIMETAMPTLGLSQFALTATMPTILIHVRLTGTTDLTTSSMAFSSEQAPGITATMAAGITAVGMEDITAQGMGGITVAAMIIAMQAGATEVDTAAAIATDGAGTIEATEPATE